eukprot:1144729-Rhodomonas_salina.1
MSGADVAYAAAGCKVLPLCRPRSPPGHEKLKRMDASCWVLAARRSALDPARSTLRTLRT